MSTVQKLGAWRISVRFFEWKGRANDDALASLFGKHSFNQNENYFPRLNFYFFKRFKETFEKSKKNLKI